MRDVVVRAKEVPKAATTVAALRFSIIAATFVVHLSLEPYPRWTQWVMDYEPNNKLLRHL